MSGRVLAVRGESSSPLEQGLSTPAQRLDVAGDALISIARERMQRPMTLAPMTPCAALGSAAGRVRAVAGSGGRRVRRAPDLTATIYRMI